MRQGYLGMSSLFSQLCLLLGILGFVPRDSLYLARGSRSAHVCLTAYRTVTAHIGCALVIFRRGETCPHLNILEVCGEERDRLSVIFVQHDTSLLCERPDHNCVCVSARAVGN